MPCCELAPGVPVCRTDGETKPVLQRRKQRWWCFKCRKRLLHTRMMFLPTAPSYYGPTFWWQCPSCGEEHVLFPGRKWVYDE
jgi:transposase-like protein